MSDWIGLAEIASSPESGRRPVARRPDTIVSRERFLAEVRSWKTCFDASNARRIGLHIEDRATFAAALYGAWHAGKIVYLPGDMQTATVTQLMRQVDACAGQLPGAIAPLAEHGLSDIVLEPLDPDATLINVFTSGSTGLPQAIPKRLAQLNAEVEALERAFGADRDAPASATATVFATVSHQHIYGLLLGTLWPLAAGRPFWTERLLYPEAIAEHLAAGPCVLVSSPAHLKRLPRSLDWAGARRHLWRVFSSGGPLTADAALLCSDLLHRSPIEIYGSSETGGIAWRQRTLHGECWQPLPAVEWKLADGRLTVRSPHLRDGSWWTTTDRARVLEQEGRKGFMLLGRVDRICKIEEKRVSLTAVENRLDACDEVCEARAVVIGKRHSQRLGIVAVLSTTGLRILHQHGKRALNERLRSALLDVVERVALPRSWRYVERLPQDAQGKSTDALLARLFRPYLPQATWLQCEPEAARAELDVSSDLIAFDGHFPGSPVLPGVVQLDWAARLARQRFAIPAGFLRAEALKFKRPVLPGATLLLDLQWNGDAGMLSFTYSSETGMHASGRLVFGEAPP